MPTPREDGGTWYTIPGDEDCEHEPLVRLGADAGSNEYYQCESCEAVLIKEGRVDYREIRERHQKEQERESDNPFSKALNMDGLMGGSDDQHRTGMYGSSSSSITVRIRKISRRLLRR